MYKNLRVSMAQTFVLCLVVVLGTLASVVRTQGELVRRTLFFMNNKCTMLRFLGLYRAFQSNLIKTFCLWYAKIIYKDVPYLMKVWLICWGILLLLWVSGRREKVWFCDLKTNFRKLWLDPFTRLKCFILCPSSYSLSFEVIFSRIANWF